MENINLRLYFYMMMICTQTMKTLKIKNKILLKKINLIDYYNQ